MATVTLSAGSGNYKYQFRITYSVTQDAEANTSTINVTKVEFQSGGNFVSSNYATYFSLTNYPLRIRFGGSSGTIVLNRTNNNGCYAYVKSSGTWYTITNATASTHSGTITHNADGTKSGTFYLQAGLRCSGYSDSSTSMTSATVSLPTIPPRYTISYNLGGGSFANGYDYTVDQTETITRAHNPTTIAYDCSNFTPSSGHTMASYFYVDTPVRNGYTFVGWNISNMTAATAQRYINNAWEDFGASSATGVIQHTLRRLRSTPGTVTFTAVWEATGFNIYNAASGTVSQVKKIYRVQNGTVEEVSAAYRVSGGVVTQL